MADVIQTVGAISRGYHKILPVGGASKDIQQGLLRVSTKVVSTTLSIEGNAVIEEAFLAPLAGHSNGMRGIVHGAAPFSSTLHALDTPTQKIKATSFVEAAALSAPQSSYEQALGKATTTATFLTGTTESSQEDGDTSAIGIIAIQMTRNPRGIVTASVPVHIVTVPYSSSGAVLSSGVSRRSFQDREDGSVPPRLPFNRVLLASESLDTDLEITLINTAPVDYTYIPPSYLKIRCFVDALSPYLRNATCPNGQTASVICPANQKGAYNVTCPGQWGVPRCTSYNAASNDYELDEGCVVTSYTRFNTTCYCRGIASSTQIVEPSANYSWHVRKLSDYSDKPITVGRRLSSGDSVEFSTVTVYLKTYYSTRFVVAPALDEVKDTSVVTGAMAILIGALLLGLFSCAFFDKKGVYDIHHPKVVKSKEKPPTGIVTGALLDHLKAKDVIPGSSSNTLLGQDLSFAPLSQSVTMPMDWMPS